MTRIFAVLALLVLPFAVRAGDADPEADYQRLDQTVWNKELQAQAHEETVIKFWDDFRGTLNKFATLKELKFESLKIGKAGAPSEFPWGITRTPWSGEGESFTPASWAEWMKALELDGYFVPECEFHQSEFDVDADGSARSTFNILVHVTQPKALKRFVVRGAVKISWSPEKDLHGNFKVKNIDATSLTVLQRTGQPAFSDPLSYKAFLLGKHSMQLKRDSHPESLIVYDLDRDGRPDVISVGWNLVFWNKEKGFERADLLATPPPSELASVMADFNGDGLPDLIVAPKSGFLMYYPGLAGGKFGEGKAIEATGKPLEECLAITCGDMDGDGALDLYVTQYKGIYGQGVMPSPSYFDANDSHPSFLLKNDGRGNFTDVTEASGLAPKRFRKTYSTTLVDLDGDGDLDLLVCSDYCGIDAYLNDGKGHFTDITDKTFDDTKCFGMSLALADYNGDGKTDIFMTGMSSTTARRLEYMKLGRSDLPEHNAMRMRMGYGNRMYFAGADGKFAQPSFKDSVARTGWSWGCSAIDFDNDGNMDVFVGNGLQSGKSSRDYCTEFWRRDVYIDSPKPNLKLEQFYNKKLQSLRSGEISWNGFEHDNLLMNVGGKDFLNVAFLMNVAYESDTRSVAGEDLNLDGRMDLVFTTAGGLNDEGLHIVANRFPSSNNWVNVQLREEGGGISPVGAKITVTTPGHTFVSQVVTGDSYMTQHSNTKHFGLGAEKQIDSIEVRWMGGKTRKIEKPAMNQNIYIKPE